MSRLREEVEAASSAEHGGLVEWAEKKIGRKVVDFSANLNPLGPPLGLDTIISNALQAIERYPDNKYEEFCQAAGEFTGASPECVVPANGSTEFIRLVAESILRPGDKVVIPTPTFAEYEANCRLFGAKIHYVPELAKADLRGARLVFLCNPNNPTGDLWPREKMIGLIERCTEYGAALFVDEAFIELSDPDQSVADVASQREGVFLLRSLTKSFAIPGLRVGFGICHPRQAAQLNAARLHWNLGTIPAYVGTVLMREHMEHIEKARKIIQEEIPYLNSQLKRLGFRPYPSSVNFILADATKTNLLPSDLVKGVLERGILIRDCASFGYPSCIRVAVRTRKENENLIGAMEAVLSD